GSSIFGSLATTGAGSAATGSFTGGAAGVIGCSAPHPASNAANNANNLSRNRFTGRQLTKPWPSRNHCPDRPNWNNYALGQAQS
ncbi:MAG: hypothetical protein QGG72_12810, partial [Verrucomicrobiota bacterium]|nr:hypothetical protein [Verrucomicrobiota bacterium]